MFASNGVALLACRTAAVLAVLALSSCSDDPLQPAPVSPSESVRVARTLEAHGEEISTLESSAAGAFAIGGQATYKLVDDEWTRVGDPAHASRASLTDAGELYAMSDFDINRLEDGHWTTVAHVALTGEYDEVNALWAYDDTHIFVAIDEYYDPWGDFYSLVMFDGSKWKGYVLPGPVNHIWGSAPDDIFLLGSNGAVLHFDGQTVTPFAGVSGNSLHAVWGRAFNDVYAVGDQGRVVHYDGVSWTGYTRPTTESLRDVRVINGKLVVAGTNGACFRFDGAVWESLSAPIAGDISDVVEDSNGDLLAATYGGILHRAAGRWRHQIGFTTEGLRSVWVADEHNVFAVGGHGVIEQRDDSGWRPVYVGSREDWWAGVSGNSPADVYVVGRAGKALHYDGAQWQPLTTMTDFHLNAVWASPERVVAVGDGAIVEWKYGVPSLMTGNIPFSPLNDVWGSASDDIFAVGENGVIIHFDGTSWQPMESGVTTTLASVWGTAHDDVFVAGWASEYYGPTRYYAATILHFDGTRWTRMESRGIEGVSSMWGAPGVGLLATGSNSLARYNGTGWNPNVLTDSNPAAYIGEAMGDIYVLNDETIYAVGRGVVRMRVVREE